MEAGTSEKKITKEQKMVVRELQNDKIDLFREFKKFIHILTLQ